MQAELCCAKSGLKVGWIGLFIWHTLIPKTPTCLIRTKPMGFCCNPVHILSLVDNAAHRSNKGNDYSMSMHSAAVCEENAGWAVLCKIRFWRLFNRSIYWAHSHSKNTNLPYQDKAQGFYCNYKTLTLPKDILTSFYSSGVWVLLTNSPRLALLYR